MKDNIVWFENTHLRKKNLLIFLIGPISQFIILSSIFYLLNYGFIQVFLIPFILFMLFQFAGLYVWYRIPTHIGLFLNGLIIKTDEKEDTYFFDNFGFISSFNNGLIKCFNINGRKLLSISVSKDIALQIQKHFIEYKQRQNPKP